MLQSMTFNNEGNSELENMFLAAAEAGEMKAILLALDYLDLFDINCVDAEGRSALVLAIRNRNIDIVELLSTHRLVNLDDALLRAVNYQYAAEVKVLCRSIQQRHLLPAALYCRCSNGDIHSDITPPVLAAQRNNYDILKILLTFGATIKEPSSYNFHSKEFTLEHSLGTIAVYEALTSEAYISLTSEDPFGRAFELSGKMKDLSESNFEFRSFYEAMSKRCENFAADLLGFVRNTEEQSTVLTHDFKVWCREDFRGDFNEPLKVKKAIKYDQKKFVAHAHCQQRLVEHWYHGLKGWRKLSTMKRLFYSFLMMLAFPVASVCYIFAPSNYPGKLLNIPYVRFLFHMTSHICFLALLSSQLVELTVETIEKANINHTNLTDILHDVHPSEMDSVNIPSAWEMAMITFVVALTWKILWSILVSGVHWLRDNTPNKLFDIITILLFWGWIGFRFFASIKFVYNFDIDLPTKITENESNLDLNLNMTFYMSPVNAGRTEGTGYIHDERLLNEIIDKLDMIMNRGSEVDEYLQAILGKSQTPPTYASKHHRMTRAARMRQTPPRGDDGRIQVDGTSEMSSLTAYHPVVLAECFLAVAKVFSFLKIVRMTVVHLKIGPMQISFGRMGGDILKFMAIFIFVLVAFAVGLTELYHLYNSDLHQECTNNPEITSLCQTPFKSFFSSVLALFWTLFGMVDLRTLDVSISNHWLTEFIGYLLFGVYHIIAIVVLLNILIAMMSNTYTRIEEDSDIQWKYSRTNLWMCYYDESFALAPPFNLLPRFSRLTGCFTTSCAQRRELKRKETVQMDSKYKELAKDLIRRYFFAKKTALLQEKEVAQDIWLMQMKHDVTGFRFTMLETLLSMDRSLVQVYHKMFESETNSPVIHSKRKNKDKPRASKLVETIQQAIKVEAQRKPRFPVRPEIFAHPELWWECPHETLTEFPYIDDDASEMSEEIRSKSENEETDVNSLCSSTIIVPQITELNGISFV